MRFIKHNYVYIWILLLFLGITVFFLNHRLYPMDCDDWTYLSYSRIAFPRAASWNPTKIFPETFEPLIGLFGAKVIAPILGDYLEGISVSIAISIGIVFTVYILSQFMFNEFVLKIGRTINILACSIFVLLHFVAFNNQCEMFILNTSVNVTINYQMSLILNIITLNLIMIYKSKKRDKLLFLIFPLIYLSINSNMYVNIGLISYLASDYICGLILLYKREHRFLKSAISPDFLLNYLCFVMWLISAYFEFNGARAQRAKETYGSIKRSLECFIESTSYLKQWVWIGLFMVLFLLIVSELLMLQTNRTEKNKDFLKFVIRTGIAFFITVVYLILLSSIVQPEYLLGSYVIFVWLYWIFSIIVQCLSHFGERNKWFAYILPVVLYILMVSTFLPNTRYMDHIDTPDRTKQINVAIIDQIVEAEQAGLKEVMIEVPKYDSSNNWPYPVNWGGGRG